MGQANYSNDDDYVILGDFNGDCSYASYNELIELSIASENYTWLIPDDADTTVGNSRCAYDRIVAASTLDDRLTGVWGIDERISSDAVSDTSRCGLTCASHVSEGLIGPWLSRNTTVYSRVQMFQIFSLLITETNNHHKDVISMKELVPVRAAVERN